MDDGTGHLIRPHSIIGMGGYGTVFKAFRLSKEYANDEEMWNTKAEAVAVKQTIFTEVTDDITVVLKEVSYLSNLQHPNIVSYYTAFTNSGGVSKSPVQEQKQKQKQQNKSKSNPNEKSKSSPSSSSSSLLTFSQFPSLCIVEELVEGASVAKVLKMISSGQVTKQISEAEIAAILYDVLQALLYIHEECRLVHRDIKPLNMLLNRSTSSVKLCDFGTCADMSQQAGRFTVIGTIGWIAPEVLDSGMMDYRSGNITSHSFPSDVWSLGVSTLEMTRPSLGKPALSEYIKDLSAAPCSVQTSVDTSRKSFLQDKLTTSSRLRDFIACCLRKDPHIRPTIRQLLEHPLIVNNNAANNKERKLKIASILESISEATNKINNNNNTGSDEKMVDDAIVLPQFASSTLSKNRCMEAIAAIKRDFFASRAPLPEKSRTSHYNWCIPSHLSSMSSSDDYRYMPTISRPQGLGQVPSILNKSSTSLSIPSKNTIPLKPIFDSVILPSTVESQRIVLSIIRKYRKLSGTHTIDGLTDIDRRNSMCYSLNELACRNIKHDRFIQLHDDLLRTFKAACISVPDFATDFLSAFMQSLTSSDNDIQSLQKFLIYLYQLQKEDLIHTHRGQLENNDGKNSNLKGIPTTSRTPRPLKFVAAEDWMRFPRMPQSAGFLNSSNIKDNEDSDTMRQQAPLVNPSAYLFNKWLKSKQADALGPM